MPLLLQYTQYFTFDTHSHRKQSTKSTSSKTMKAMHLVEYFVSRALVDTRLSTHAYSLTVAIALIATVSKDNTVFSKLTVNELNEKKTLMKMYF